MNNFRKRFNGPRLSPEEADRQGRISWLAFDKLGQVNAIAFLNTHDEGLGGRPLDIAIKDNAGFATVEAAIAVHVPGPASEVAVDPAG